MLHIILLILKVIGIIVLVILGVVLTALFMILLIPIRYLARVEKYDDISGVVKAGWLFRILYFRAEYKEETFVYFVKLFGITIRSNLPKKEKIDREKTIKKTKPKKVENTTNRSGNVVEQIPQNNNNTEKQDTKFETKTEQQVMKRFDSNNLDTNNQYTNNQDINNLDIYNQDSRQKEFETKNHHKKNHHKKNHFVLFWRQLKQKYRFICNTIKSIWLKICNFFISFKDKLQSIFSSVQNLRRKIELIKAFLDEEQNIIGIKYAFLSVKKTLKHCLPRKFEGELQLGTGDPCSTGQALGVVSMLYAYYGDSIQVIPDFENEIMEGYIQVRGRIRLGTLLIIAIKLLLNENFKQLLNNYRKLKEEL